MECAVVTEEPRGPRLLYYFLKYPVTAFSTCIRLTGSISSLPISGAAVTMENVAIFDSPGKGRGLKATKEFWAGDVIFSEPSLAAVVFDR